MFNICFRIVIVLSIVLLTACSLPQATTTQVVSTPAVTSTATEVPAIITSTPTSTSFFLHTPTPFLDMWTTYSNPDYAISLQYPADWQPAPGYDDQKTGEIRFENINGFFQIGAMDTSSIDAAAAAEAEHKLQPYGSQPTIEILKIHGQEARLILPSADQPAGMHYQAALIVRYPNPVNILGTPCHFFVLWADVSHIRTIAQTLNFTN